MHTQTTNILSLENRELHLGNGERFQLDDASCTICKEWTPGDYVRYMGQDNSGRIYLVNLRNLQMVKAPCPQEANSGQS